MSTPTTRRPVSSRPPSKPPRKVGSKPIAYELIGVGLIALGVILFFAPHMHGGVPSLLLKVMQWLFGTYGAWGIAVALVVLGVFLLVRLAQMEISMTSLGMLVLYLVFISMCQLTQHPVWFPHTFATTPGGLFGGLIAGGLHAMLDWGAWIVLTAFGLCGIALLTEMPLWKILLAPFKGLYLLGRFMFNPVSEKERERRNAERAAKVAALKDEELKRRNRPEQDPQIEPLATPMTGFSLPDPPSFMVSPEELPEDEEEAAPKGKKRASRDKAEQLTLSDAEDEAIAPEDPRPYNLPPVDLLTLTPKPAKMGKDDTNEKIVALEETLRSFSIDAKVVGVERGPRVTRFEMVPPPGIRINRITNLADNIALSLAALDVRVEAPVPGKGVVGIEVPNKESVIVDLREIIESDTMQKSKSPLAFSLGRDIAGVPCIADLTRMPHLLIAGATNSGKSVCINTLICSILMRATPRQVKFLMVDPKRVELSLFQSIPHLIAPVAYDAKHAAGLLRWAIREMEQRYEMFAEKGVRNIIGFNEQSRLEGLEELPYIVIIIDELADLMMQAAAEFEASICRIAQLARATGIHLVVATQRPSVNVITGTIKANVPSRIAFAVASQVDSRTILDMNGAERLVGQGDMLFLPVDASKPNRIQGAYVSEKDINRIVEHVKSQGKPHFTDEIVAIEEEALGGEDGGPMSDEPEDELYAKALEYVRTTKYASTSMLQRKFRIGYTRAARIMDQFEERGFVGPGQGSKPREVIFAPAGSVTSRYTASQDEDEEEERSRYQDEE